MTKSCSIYPGCWDKRGVSLHGILCWHPAASAKLASSVCQCVLKFIAPHTSFLYALSGGISLATVLSMWPPALHTHPVRETPLVRSSRNFPLVFLSPLESILLPQHPLMRSFSGLPILPFFFKKDIRAKIQNYQLSQNVAMEGTRNS